MVLSLIVLLAFQAAAQQEPVFRAGVASVKVDVQVTERNGRTISNLAADDFQVFDDDRPQKIAYFGRESEPLDLLLLLDVSGSMHRHLEELAGTARAALAQLGPGDRVGVMLFARKAAVREEMTADFHAVEQEIRNAVHEQDLGGGTELNAAIIAAAGYLEKQPPKGRRAVLIVTDNLSLNYKVPDQDVIRALDAADSVLNGILIGKQKRPDAVKPGRYVNPDFTPSDIFKLAAETGGEALEAKRVGESFPGMIERIRARYNLQYNAPPSEPGAFHRVRVDLTAAAQQRHRGAVVRARAGYYATLK